MSRDPEPEEAEGAGRRAWREAERPPREAEGELAVLGIGANLGEPLEQCRRAVMALDRLDGCVIIRVSSLYWSAPVGYERQPWFANAVVSLTSWRAPRDLWLACCEIEQRMGRVRDVVGGPRTIDIDILLFGSRQVDTPELTIPHPRYGERRFVLEPLVEIMPEGRDPRTGAPFRRLLEALGDTQPVRRAAPPPDPRRR
jgi:2-amino-4-hydroxy-6-hydroxymethyldihydropteridine diphosphokinase